MYMKICKEKKKNKINRQSKGQTQYLAGKHKSVCKQNTITWGTEALPKTLLAIRHHRSVGGGSGSVI